MQSRIARPPVLSYDPAAISYTVTGTGPPLVLVHGLAGSRRWWSRTSAGLAAYFQVYALDLVGFGMSQSAPFVLHDAAARLVHWLDHVGLATATFVGHSMGGVVVAQLAATWPERVTQVVFVDAAVLPIALLSLPLNLLRAAWYTPTSLWPILLTDAYRAGPLTLLLATYDLVTTDLRADLPRIRMPALIVWGPMIGSSRPKWVSSSRTSCPMRIWWCSPRPGIVRCGHVPPPSTRRCWRFCDQRTPRGVSSDGIGVSAIHLRWSLSRRSMRRSGTAVVRWEWTRAALAGETAC